MGRRTCIRCWRTLRRTVHCHSMSKIPSHDNGQFWQDLLVIGYGLQQHNLFYFVLFFFIARRGSKWTHRVVRFLNRENAKYFGKCKSRVSYLTVPGGKVETGHWWNNALYPHLNGATHRGLWLKCPYVKWGNCFENTVRVCLLSTMWTFLRTGYFHYSQPEHRPCSTSRMEETHTNITMQKTCPPSKHLRHGFVLKRQARPGCRAHEVLEIAEFQLQSSLHKQNKTVLGKGRCNDKIEGICHFSSAKNMLDVCRHTHRLWRAFGFGNNWHVGRTTYWSIW